MQQPIYNDIIYQIHISHKTINLALQFYFIPGVLSNLFSKMLHDKQSNVEFSI